MLKTLYAVWTQTQLIGPGVVQVHNVLMGREIVMMIVNVTRHFCVAMTIVEVDQLKWIVVLDYAIMILIAWTKSATQTPINVAWIPIALIGPIAVNILYAIKRRVIVINMLSVKENYCVVLTIALLDQHIWTAVQVAQLLDICNLGFILAPFKFLNLRKECQNIFHQIFCVELRFKLWLTDAS